MPDPHPQLFAIQILRYSIVQKMKETSNFPGNIEVSKTLVLEKAKLLHCRIRD